MYTELRFPVISCFKLLSASLSQSKWKLWSPVVITILLPFIYIPINIMTCLNCCKGFWLFYCVDKVYTLFVWFFSLICMNYFIMLEVWLIVSSELRFWFVFLLFLLLNHILLLASLVHNQFHHHVLLVLN